MVSAENNHHLSFWVINIFIVQAENPHLRIFVLYLLRDPRASLADIKVKHMKEVLFGLMLYKSELVICIFPIMCVYLFRLWGSSGREVGVESKCTETRATRRCLHNHHHWHIVSEALCHHQMIFSNDLISWKLPCLRLVSEHQVIQDLCALVSDDVEHLTGTNHSTFPENQVSLSKRGRDFNSNLGQIRFPNPLLFWSRSVGELDYFSYMNVVEIYFPGKQVRSVRVESVRWNNDIWVHGYALTCEIIAW